MAFAGSVRFTLVAPPSEAGAIFYNTLQFYRLKLRAMINLRNREHEMLDVYSRFEQGILTIGSQQIELGALSWKAHPKFAGVFLKDLLTVSQTNGRLSCHLVRIEPGHAIGRHAHGDSMELHEIIKGSGMCLTPNGEIAYRPGVMCLLMPNEAHEVSAGEEGLHIFAKFIPALV